MSSLGIPSATVGLLCLGLAIFLWKLWGGQDAGRYGALALVITGAAALAGSAPGQWLRGATVTADSMVSSATGELTGAVIAGVVGIVVAMVVVAGIVTSITKITLLAGLLLPLAMVMIPGPAGDLTNSLVRLVAGLIGLLVAWPFGLA